MGRFMYIHFGDDVPRNIEKEYNKLLRKERYLEERDAENGMIYPDFDAVLAANPDPARYRSFRKSLLYSFSMLRGTSSPKWIYINLPITHCPPYQRSGV